ADQQGTLGKGSFGEVARSCRRSTGEMVAIKILRNEGNQGQSAWNEVKLLRALQAVDTEAAHIVRFLESFQDSACTYLVFELLEQSLFEFQKNNNFSPLPVRHIRTIVAQVLVALAKLKELAIIHADLKPENIMLVDHARHPFRKMDMWSLGCVVAELHLGRPLYPGRNEDEQVRYICKTQGLPPGRLLCTARKAQRFFQRAPDPAGAWQLKSAPPHLTAGASQPLPAPYVTDVHTVRGAPVPLEHCPQLALHSVSPLLCVSVSPSYVSPRSISK
uniref:Homeodomain interacting protein kinase 4 n=1 Tax=Anas platyrhynchos TaxID=8839 RepID=A0A8B9QRI6_ANAPL